MSSFIRNKHKKEKDAVLALASAAAAASGRGGANPAVQRAAQDIIVGEHMLEQDDDDDDDEDDEDGIAGVGRENADSDDDDDDDDEDGAVEDPTGGLDLSTFDGLMTAVTVYHVPQGNIKAALQALAAALPLASTAEEQAAVYDTVAMAHMEKGDDAAIQAALEALSTAEGLAPGSSYERHLNVAELLNGRESLDAYARGLAVLEAEAGALPPKRAREDPQLTAERAELALTAARVMSAMASLYLTELCDEDEAEQECERLTAAAVRTCPGSAEAQRTLASLRMIQGDAAAAVKAAKACYNCLVAASARGDEPLEFMQRVSIAELLLKLECWGEACELLNALLDEDDKIVELWAHAGHAHMRLAAILTQDTQQQCLEAAAQFYISARRLLKAAPDAELAAGIDAALAELSAGGVDLAGVEARMDAQGGAQAGALEDIVSDDEDDAGAGAGAGAGQDMEE